MSTVTFALAWVLKNRFVSSAIAGPRTEEQWDGYLAALEAKLGPEDEAFVDSLVPPGHASTPGYTDPAYPIASDGQAPVYTADELVAAGSRELGVAAEAIGGAIERIFADNGDRPTAYIAGEEAAGAAMIGARYGRGGHDPR